MKLLTKYIFFALLLPYFNTAAMLTPLSRLVQVSSSRGIRHYSSASKSITEAYNALGLKENTSTKDANIQNLKKINAKRKIVAQALQHSKKHISADNKVYQYCETKTANEPENTDNKKTDNLGDAALGVSIVTLLICGLLLK